MAFMKLPRLAESLAAVGAPCPIYNAHQFDKPNSLAVKMDGR
jgi:hypothetical protein